MKLKSFFWFFLFNIAATQAQTYEISTYQPTTETFTYLLESNSFISKNDTINELVVDLVTPILLDSMIERKKQHHKVGIVGWAIHALAGFNWRAFSMKKEKVVGTIVRESRSGSQEFTEYDINFDLNFHLNKYLFRIFEMYDKQGKIKRQDVRPSHKTDYKSPPFVNRDTNNIDIRQYRLHCELTPDRAFRGSLNYLFYPTLPGGGNLGAHPNLGTRNPAVGFYGTMCLDCNHSCHPELHPYEWMWWLKCTDSDTSYTKEWNIGIFHEGSNRMKKWSVNPMTGQIRIPFAFKMEESATIEIEHGVLNRFMPEELAKMNIPTTNFDASVQKRIVQIKGKDVSKDIQLHFVNPIVTQGLKYWLTDINYDEKNKIVSGYFCYALSAMDLYTCKIRID